MLGEKVTCATVSLHVYILSNMYTSSLLPATSATALGSDIGDFNNGVCHVI